MKQKYLYIIYLIINIQNTQLLQLSKINLIKKRKDVNRHFKRRYTYRQQKKYMKKCSTPVTIREMQVKIKIAYHSIFTRMAIIKKKKENKSCLRCGEIRILMYCWWEYRLIQLL
jgi:hypothetical protein